MKAISVTEGEGVDFLANRCLVGVGVSADFVQMVRPALKGFKKTGLEIALLKLDCSGHV